MTKDQIKHEIELEIENLKFYQAFILPVGTGIIVLLSTRRNILGELYVPFLLVGIFALAFLFLQRRWIKWKLRKLFNQL